MKEKFSRSYWESYAYNEANIDFDNPKKAKIAAEAFICGMDYFNNIPIGWNCNTDIKEVEARLTRYINSTYNPKPYGFFVLPGFGWLFLAFLQGLIGWAVRKLMDKFYPNLI